MKFHGAILSLLSQKMASLVNLYSKTICSDQTFIAPAKRKALSFFLAPYKSRGIQKDEVS